MTSAVSALGDLPFRQQRPTTAPATAEMFDAVLRGATDPEIVGVDVVRRTPPTG